MINGLMKGLHFFDYYLGKRLLLLNDLVKGLHLLLNGGPVSSGLGMCCF